MSREEKVLIEMSEKEMEELLYLLLMDGDFPIQSYYGFDFEKKVGSMGVVRINMYEKLKDALVVAKDERNGGQIDAAV